MSITCGKAFTAIAATAVMTAFMLSCGAKGPDGATSPNGRISITVTPNGGQTGDMLTCTVMFDGTAVVADSPLGIEMDNGVELSKGLKLISSSTSAVDETYRMPYGTTGDIRNACNETALSFMDSDGRLMDVIVRAYDDGAAFRYAFPAQNGLESFGITGEKTAFDFDGDHSYWGLHLNKFTTSYETDYTAATLKNITPGELIGLPLLVKAGEKAWVAVTEANLTDYAGMYLSGSTDKSNRLTAVLSPHPDSSGVCVHARAPRSTPWRVLMIADNPGRLVESNIILNLNEPCAIETSWIKPGKTAWDWWSGQTVKGENFTGAMDDRTMKHYIDFAGEMGLEYMLIDANWYGNHTKGEEDITVSITEIDVPGLVKYAAAKNVGILLWLNWRCVDRQMDEAFPLYESWGVKGVKVDYMDRDDQEMVNFYHRVVKKAAEHHLVVDFHGAYKPTGIRRTWPNLITREGVMGLEYVKWSARTTPEHDCILPFTRMLAGPMDYTPGGFTNATQEQFTHRNLEPMTMGTRCHQLALYVVFESPLQMLVDHPANYRGRDGVEFLRHVPVTWDDTKVLTAEVGDCAVIARRNGDEWYLGAITDWSPRTVDVPLSFLGRGDYAAEIYADGDDAASNAESVKISTVLVSASDTMTVAMGPGGGCAVRFYPAPSGSDFPRLK